MMQYRFKFAVLNDDVLFDLERSLFVMISRILPEGEEGIWKMKLIHDPNVLPHVREAILSSDTVKRQQILDENSRILSANYISFFEFNLIKQTIEDRLRWNVRAIDEGLPRIRFRSLIDGRSYHCADPKKLLLTVFENLLLLPGLTRGKWQGPRVAEVSLSERQYAYLTGASADDVPNPAILDERPLALQVPDIGLHF